MPYRKVLIIRLSALGDVAMTIPVVLFRMPGLS